MKTKHPPKAQLERAVKAVQLLLGCGPGRVRIEDEQKLRKKAVAAVEKVSKKVGFDAWQQIETEATKRGHLLPTPGRDI